MGDERKVKQVLLNRLSNAVKFTPERGRISLKAGRPDGASFGQRSGGTRWAHPERAQAELDERARRGGLSRAAPPLRADVG